MIEQTLRCQPDCKLVELDPSPLFVVAIAFLEDALELMLAHDAGARVLVVGHEPSFSQVVHDLTGAQVDVKKGGVAAVRLADGAAELIVLLRPRELEALAVAQPEPQGAVGA